MLLDYFWGKKKSPHDLLSNPYDVIYFWEKQIPHNLLSSLHDNLL